MPTEQKTPIVVVNQFGRIISGYQRDAIIEAVTHGTHDLRIPAKRLGEGDTLMEIKDPEDKGDRIEIRCTILFKENG